MGPKLLSASQNISEPCLFKIDRTSFPIYSYLSINGDKVICIYIYTIYIYICVCVCVCACVNFDIDILLHNDAFSNSSLIFWSFHGKFQTALRLIAGPLHSGVARERAPTTIRALWGTDGTSNAIHTSVDMESADKESCAPWCPCGTFPKETSSFKHHAPPYLYA